MKKPFIHLRCLSSYSLSESTLKIQKLVQVAKKNNMPALAITDNNNMFGVFEFAQECIKNNVPERLPCTLMTIIRTVCIISPV